MVRRLPLIIAVSFLAGTLAAFAASDDTPPPPTIPCGAGIPGVVSCQASKGDLKAARKAYDKGVKLEERQQPEEALARFEEATQLAPQDVKFLTAREVVKAQLVFHHIERGNVLMLADARMRAAAEFRAALDLDSDNEFARERLDEATRSIAPALPFTSGVQVQDSGEIHLEPQDGRATFHYTGDVRGLFEELSAAFGVKSQFDDSVQARQVRFNVDDVDFFTALKLACEVSKTMWAAVDDPPDADCPRQFR